MRRQAHALRHKLAEYYSTEGKQDPIRVEIPLGHYVPSFEPNPEAVEEESIEVQEKRKFRREGEKEESQNLPGTPVLR